MCWLFLLSAKDIFYILSMYLKKDQSWTSVIYLCLYKWRSQLPTSMCDVTNGNMNWLGKGIWKFWDVFNIHKWFSGVYSNWRCFWFSYPTPPNGKWTGKTSCLKLRMCSCISRHKIAIWLNLVACSLLLKL